VKVLLDHNVPYPLTNFLRGHDLATADDMGWARLENGDLLRAAEDAGFDVMITADKNLSYQQNLQGRKLSLVVLSTNNWSVLSQNVTAALRAVNSSGTGSFTYVDI
jgi:hypothetical protein